MARIIYKKGLEGQNRLESIEGVEIELLNGQKALIYPKYAERDLLKSEIISKWGATQKTEIEALKNKEDLFPTYELLMCESPAAKFVVQFRTDERRIFALPTLLAAMEIQDQKKDIDELAMTIEGADLLRNFTSNVWSCSRYSESYGWLANGSNDFADGGVLYGAGLAVPLILY